LTLSNCISAIQEAKNECKSKDITIIGGSLGGYILMEALGEDKELCKRAIIMMSGQNVGVNRGMLASLGLWAMGKACNFFSQADIAKKFMQAAAKNTNL
jgi:alpha-beta hydrolase superfamily lysophospholipase